MSWFSYSDDKEQKEQVARKIAKLQKKGESFVPIVPTAGRTKISTTFWGQAWCKNLESYADYETRLPRGRSYLRKGNVYNLEIAHGMITAVVAGSDLYDTRIKIAPLQPEDWKEITAACAGQVFSMLDLLAGKLGDGTMRVLTDPEKGMFPRPNEIKFICSCPDAAGLCKHSSAVLYGVGVLLDARPELLFTLRGVDQSEMLSAATDATLSGLVGDAGADAQLAGTDLSALFGIDLGEMPNLDAFSSALSPLPAPAVAAAKPPSPAKAKPKQPKAKTASSAKKKPAPKAKSAKARAGKSIPK